MASNHNHLSTRSHTEGVRSLNDAARSRAEQWASGSADGKMSGASGRTVTGCGAGVWGRTETHISFSTAIKVEITADG